MAGYGCDPRLGAMLYHAGEDADAVATAALLVAMDRRAAQERLAGYPRSLLSTVAALDGARASVARPARGRRWRRMTR